MQISFIISDILESSSNCLIVLLASK